MTLEELLALSAQQGMQPPDLQPQGLDLASLMAPAMPPMDYSGVQPTGMVNEGAPQLSPLHANFLDRLGLAFQNLPPVDTSQSGGASLFQGLAQGFGAGRGGGFQREQAANTAENARLSESARHMAQTRWQNYQMEAQKLKAQRATADAQVAAQRQAKQDARAEGYYQLAQRKANEPPGSGAGGDAQTFDSIAQGIIEGTVPPTQVSGRGTKYSYGVVAAMRKLDPKFNLSKANLDYGAVQRFVATQNGRLPVSIRQAAATVLPGLDHIDELTRQLDKLAPQFRNTPLNRLANKANREWGMMSPEAQNIATQLNGQIATTVPELSQIYMAGGVPTDRALVLAGEVVNSGWPTSRIRAGVGTERTNIRYRVNSINTAQPMGVSGYGQFDPSQYGGQPPMNPYWQPGGATAPVSDEQAKAEYEALVKARGKK